MYACLSLSIYPSPSRYPRSNVLIIKTAFVFIVVRLPFRSRVNRFLFIFFDAYNPAQKRKTVSYKNIDRPDIGD